MLATSRHAFCGEQFKSVLLGDFKVLDFILLQFDLPEKSICSKIITSPRSKSYFTVNLIVKISSCDKIKVGMQSQFRVWFQSF